MEENIKALIKNTLTDMGINDFDDFVVEVPKDPKNGDFATNVAMKLARVLRKNPREIADTISKNIKDDIIDKVEIAGPGFINFFIKKSFYEDVVKQVISDESYFKLSYGNEKKVLVEFVSANPTGPLHIGHGRGAAFGDSLARLMKAAGYDVYTEYYVNDAGNQMKMLGESIYLRYKQLVEGKLKSLPDGYYKGDYIIDIAKKVLDEYGDKFYDDEKRGFEVCFEIGLKEITESIENDLREFRVEFDNWFSEKSLYDAGEVEKALEILREKGFIYEKDGAVWFKSSEFGDEKDRVVKKADGSYTYFASDIAYHLNKMNRGFDLLINIWGADHHGYISRMQGALKAFGFENVLKVILIQMVNLIKNKERISMSTRAGEFIPLKWLLDEVGVDAARFFYLLRDHNAQFDFDIDLAKSKSSDNPVYYVQYVYARVNSLFENANDKNIEFKENEDLELLTSEKEKEIVKKIYEFKKVIQTAAMHLEPHRITYYLQDLAALFHNYYYNVKIITEDSKLTNARLNLSLAVAKTVKYGLNILGVSAPEKM